MNKAVPWNISGVGFDAREAARTAARRQGKSLGAWLHGVIEDHASELGIAATDVADQDRIEAVTAKLERLSQKSAQEFRSTRDVAESEATSDRPPHAVASQHPAADRREFDTPLEPPRRTRRVPHFVEETESLLEEAIEALERRSMRAQRRTEDAIASFARLLETNESKRDLERVAVRELSQKLSEIETKLTARETPADPTPIVGALARLEARLDKISQRSEAESEARHVRRRFPLDAGSRHEPLAHYDTAMEASTGRNVVGHSSPTQRRLGDAITEISRRQRILDEPHTLAVEAGSAGGWARRPPVRHDAEVAAPWQRSLSDMQAEIAGLAAKIEDMRRDVARPRDGHRVDRREPGVDLNALRAEIGTMSQALSDLTPRGVTSDSDGFDEASAARMDTSRDLRGPTAVRGGVRPAADDIRQPLEAVDAQPKLGRIETELQAIAAKVDGLSGTNETVLSRLLAQMDEIHELIAKSADRAPAIGPIAADARASGPAAGVDAARSPTFEQIENRLDALTQKLDHAIQTPPHARAEIAALERLVLALSDKIEAAQAPGADKGAIEALQTEIASVSARFGQSMGDLGSLTTLHTSVNDLFAHLDDTRSEIEMSVSTATSASPPSRPSLPDVAALKALQEDADNRTQSTLNAVHQTLEHIVGRMSAMETDLAKTRRPRLPGSVTDKPIARLDAAREPMAAPIGTERGKAGFASTRPKVPPADESNGREDFIAAARRAAKLAQANPSVDAIRQPAVDTDARAGLLAKSRDYVATHKRPVLLSVAAVFVVLGTMAIIQRMTFDIDDSKIAATTPAKITRVADAVIALPATAVPTTVVAAGDLSPSALPIGARAPTAQIPGSDPIQTGSITGIPSFALGSVNAPAKPAIPPGLTTMADSGDAAAEYELASRYADGKIVPRDFKRAAQWYSKAADQGIAPAEYRLAALYEKGLGVPQDKTKAKALYQRAADAGNPRAMHNLAVLLADGDGKPDYPGAVTWFRKAAQYGVHDSQYNLAILLARGLGVEQSLIQSYQWFAIAAAQNDADAAKKRDEVGDKMSAADLAVAKTLAASFQPRKANVAAVEVASPPGGWDSVGTASHLNSAKSKISSL